MRKRVLLRQVLDFAICLLSLPCACGANQVDLKKSADPAPPSFNSTSEVIAHYGNGARTFWKSSIAARGNSISYPPKRLSWVCLKEEKLLQVFAQTKSNAWILLHTFPIIGASGGQGPKLKEGDKQVPEGFYKLVGFRPKLVAHIGMDVNYPNDEDKAHAKMEKRTNLGGDILIHGSKWSTGCLAMGNDAISKLFVLAYDTGCNNIDLIFAPCDLTKKVSTPSKQSPTWVAGLYEKIRQRLLALNKTLPG